MKLWEKETLKDLGEAKMVEEFTVGNDRVLDMHIASYDVMASIAHAKMLGTTGIIPLTDSKLLITELENILSEIRSGKFRIEEGVEDVHSQLEIILTQRLGEAGKKIHTARSRNDQSLTAIKLFIKDELKTVLSEMNSLCKLLLKLSTRHKCVLLPGYTHFQVAMPSSFGLWFGAYAESLDDDKHLLGAALAVADKNPLGSAAGYGTSFPIDREMTTKELGFAGMNENVVYAQMTRGKTEKIAAVAVAGIASTLNKLAYDAILFMSQDLGFISFPDQLTTGSSIMPHKKNPDVWEIIRGKTNQLMALPNTITMMTTNLPSGYHRDFQLLKEEIFPAFGKLKSCISMATLMLKSIQVREDILSQEKYKHVFSVAEVNKLVMQGVSFREAYRKVAKEIEEGSF